MSRDLNDTLIFAKVVEQGSFTAAAKFLGLPKTTVSRKVQELEERLGAQLPALDHAHLPGLKGGVQPPRTVARVRQGGDLPQPADVGGELDLWSLRAGGGDEQGGTQGERRANGLQGHGSVCLPDV